MGPGSIDSLINWPYILKFWLNVTIHSADAHYIFNYCGISLLAVQMSFTKSTYHVHWNKYLAPDKIPFGKIC